MSGVREVTTLLSLWACFAAAAGSQQLHKDASIRFIHPQNEQRDPTHESILAADIGATGIAHMSRTNKPLVRRDARAKGGSNVMATESLEKESNTFALVTLDEKLKDIQASAKNDGAAKAKLYGKASYTMAISLSRIDSYWPGHPPFDQDPLGQSNMSVSQLLTAIESDAKIPPLCMIGFTRNRTYNARLDGCSPIIAQRGIDFLTQGRGTLGSSWPSAVCLFVECALLLSVALVMRSIGSSKRQGMALMPLGPGMESPKSEVTHQNSSEPSDVHENVFLGNSLPAPVSKDKAVPATLDQKPVQELANEHTKSEHHVECMAMETDSFGQVRQIALKYVQTRVSIGNMATFMLCKVILCHFVLEKAFLGFPRFPVWLIESLSVSLRSEDVAYLVGGYALVHAMGGQERFRLGMAELIALAVYVTYAHFLGPFVEYGSTSLAGISSRQCSDSVLSHGQPISEFICEKAPVGEGPKFFLTVLLVARLIIVTWQACVGKFFRGRGEIASQVIIIGLTTSLTCWFNTDHQLTSDFDWDLMLSFSYLPVYLVCFYFGLPLMERLQSLLLPGRVALVCLVAAGCFVAGMCALSAAEIRPMFELLDYNGDSFVGRLVSLVCHLILFVPLLIFFVTLPPWVDFRLSGPALLAAYMLSGEFCVWVWLGVSLHGLNVIPSVFDFVWAAGELPYRVFFGVSSSSPVLALLSQLLQFVAVLWPGIFFMLLMKWLFDACSILTLRLSPHLQMAKGLVGITNDAGPVKPAAANYDPSLQKLCQDYVGGDWKSFYDFIPDKEEPFLYAGDQRKPLSFKALREFINRPELDIPGLGREDRLCTAFPSGAELAVCSLVYTLRCQFAPLNMMLRPEEFKFEFEDLPAKALLVQRIDHLRDAEEEQATGFAVTAALRQNLSIILQLVPDKEVVGLFTLEDHPSGKPLNGASIGRPLESISRDQVALVLHTSGTTKKPKIVPITHESLAIGCRCHASADLLDGSDVFVNFMPMFHIAGVLENLLVACVSGSKFVALRGRFRPQVFYEALLAEPFPTAYSAVPFHNLALIQWAQSLEQSNGKPFENHVKYIRNDSAALVPSLALQMEDYMKAAVAPAYSMTESNPISSNPRYGVRKLKSVGQAVGPEIVLLEGFPSTAQVKKPGQEGEVAVKGACVMTGYEMRPHMEQDPNIETFTEGFMRSGDKGWMDADGYLYLVGRIKELINRGGEKMSPFEVEDAVRKHDAVNDCLCFAAPQQFLGEVVGVVVTLKDGKELTIGDLNQWLLDQNDLAKMWCPEILVRMPDIPKGPTGKPARINLASKLGLEMLTGEIVEIDHSGL